VRVPPGCRRPSRRSKSASTEPASRNSLGIVVNSRRGGPIARLVRPGGGGMRARLGGRARRRAPRRHHRGKRSALMTLASAIRAARNIAPSPGSDPPSSTAVARSNSDLNSGGNGSASSQICRSWSSVRENVITAPARCPKVEEVSRPRESCSCSAPKQQPSPIRCRPSSPIAIEPRPLSGVVGAPYSPSLLHGACRHFPRASLGRVSPSHYAGKI
jgi:hypothetical protein